MPRTKKINHFTHLLLETPSFHFQSAVVAPKLAKHPVVPATAEQAARVKMFLREMSMIDPFYCERAPVMVAGGKKKNG